MNVGLRLFILIGLLLGAFCSVSQGASVTVGSGIGRAGGTAEVAISVDSSTELAGVNVRLEYPSAALHSPTIERNGAMLMAGHVVASNAPENGRLDIVAWTGENGGAFGSSAGEVLKIRFEIDASATQGSYPVSFTSVGPAILASSGLSDTQGRSLSHDSVSGQVLVTSPGNCDLNGDGRTDDMDLFVIAEHWHQAHTGIADMNLDGWVNESDLYFFTRDWKESIAAGGSAEPNQ